MSFHATLEDLPRPGCPVVLAIGNFDGLHLGHQAVIRQCRQRAEALNGEAWLLTFDPHPCNVVDPDRCQPLLCSPDQKRRQLEAAGLDRVVLMPFERATADLSPERFIGIMVEAIPDLAAVVVGENWRFGKQAAGDFSTLESLGKAFGFAAIPTDIALWEDERVSSTRVRAAVTSGDLQAVTAMLGRRYAVEGKVVPGRRVGREQGFPTANIHCGTHLFPPPGIYAVASPVGNTWWGGAAYLNDSLIRSGVIEVHYFDVDEDLYGHILRVELIEQLRPDRHFESGEELVAQIARDVAQAQECFRRLAL